MKKYCLLFFILLFSFSCAGSKVSQSVGFVPPRLIIALAPSGGVLAEAIGIELFNRGYTVVDTKEMSNLMLRHNMIEYELSRPENLKILADNGIGGILTVKAVVGYDSKPQSASVRLNNTNSWKIMAGVSWNNGWGGRAGSIADRSMRKDLTGAAKEIVKALLSRRR